jgi:MSHA pilin protein MshA
MHYYHVLMAKGFTLTELMVFIAILAVISAIALPKFINMSTDNQTTALAAISNALSTACTTNYNVRKLNPKLGKAIANCTDVGKILQGGLPAGYVIKPNRVAENITESCTITGPSSTSYTFKAIGIR